VQDLRYAVQCLGRQFGGQTVIVRYLWDDLVDMVAALSLTDWGVLETPACFPWAQAMRVDAVHGVVDRLVGLRPCDAIPVPTKVRW